MAPNTAGVARDGARGADRARRRGLHPAALTQDGLEVALATIADRSPVPVRLQVALGRRLPPEVEATCYFVVSEALTNAARHAQAEVVDVIVSLRPDRLTIEISDDGVGGASAEEGSGLQGLADRLSALGARLEFESPPGRGTTIRTVLACE